MLIYNPRNKYHKSHYGAVPEGAAVRFTVNIPKDTGVYEAFLVVWRDGGHTQHIPLEFSREDDFARVYGGMHTFAEAGLYFYYFAFSGHAGYIRIGRGRYNDGVLGLDTDYSQTVYRHDSDMSAVLSGGVIYQIFPDRFFKGGREKTNVPPDRFLQQDITAQPAYLQNGEPRSLGNDYYGGDLAGITQKLPYIKSLGVTAIYLNPIFSAHSNHRYNTADYTKIDCLLGDERDFVHLCVEAHKLGMKIILDGVFSHTGDDSIYFNRFGRYDSVGAYQSEHSPYAGWYTFERRPDKYSCWWGVPSLPETNEENPDFLEFICGEQGVLRRWLRLGADGWRLDVADELPDVFLDRCCAAVKAEKPDAVIIGEVWEDASLKISHGGRRRFVQGGQMDSVMNYVFYDAILSFVRGGGVPADERLPADIAIRPGSMVDAGRLAEIVLCLCENYPAHFLNNLMNHLGTHDTARLLTLLGGEPAAGRGRGWQAEQCLTEEQRETGLRRLRLAAVLGYTLPGVPSLYYGDEMAMAGHSDPFNRAAVNWDENCAETGKLFAALGALRAAVPPLKNGRFTPCCCAGRLICFLREGENGQVLFVAANAGEPADAFLPEGFVPERTLLGKTPENGRFTLLECEFSVISGHMRPIVKS